MAPQQYGLDATPTVAPRPGTVGWTLLKIDSSRTDDGTLSIRLKGDLDVYSAGDLLNRLRKLEPQCTDVVVDLSGLEFLDCAGVRELIDAARRAEVRGGRLTLLEGPPAVQRVFDLSGVGDALFLARAF